MYVFVCHTITPTIPRFSHINRALSVFHLFYSNIYILFSNFYCLLNFFYFYYHKNILLFNFVLNKEFYNKIKQIEGLLSLMNTLAEIQIEKKRVETLPTNSLEKEFVNKARLVKLRAFHSLADLCSNSHRKLEYH